MGTVKQLHDRPHIHIFCWLVWNLLPYNTATRQLRGLYLFFFILHLKSLSCAGNYGAQHGGATLVKFHPIQNVATWKTAKDQPESQTGKPHHQSKLYREKQALHVFWMKEFFKRQWSTALIIQYRGENVYKTGSSLVAKDET